MSVVVRIPTVFRKLTSGREVVDLEPGTVGDLVDQLETRFPGMRAQLITDGGELHRFVNVYVNDEDVRFLGGLDAEVSDGDQVVVLPAVAGGSLIDP